MKKNSLYYGDCLEVMKQFPEGSVDLIYLDPPFNSSANYNILFKNQRPQHDNGDDLAQITAFTDTWFWSNEAQERVDNIKRAVGHPAHKSIRALDLFFKVGTGMLSYLSYMAERLAEMSRVLKDTGSIYLHCDPTASHYLKIIMDDIFDSANFRNEIIWGYEKPRPAKKIWRRNHDIILFYTKCPEYTFNVQRVPLMDGSFEMRKPFKRPDGSIWRPKEPGKQAGSWWYDIPSFATRMTAKERLGYPTQKPIALLSRIVKASSNEGDLVMDPFCGCGTTIEAAHVLKRNWIGIDVSFNALDVVRKERLQDMKIPVQGEPKDLAAATDLARENPFDFEKWAVTRIPGFWPNDVQVGDGGIDGRAAIFQTDKNENNLCIAQVKGGKPSTDSLTAFTSRITGGSYAMGLFITLNKIDTPTARQCIASAGKIEIGAKKYRRMVMWSIQEHFSGIKAELPAMAHPRTGKAYQLEVPQGNLLGE